jgi:hypothetical protein
MTKITQNHDLCPYLNTVPRVPTTRRIQALEMGVMTRLVRGAGLVIIAVVLAGCGSNAAGSSGPDRMVIDVSPELARGRPTSASSLFL